jgi:hypothetical protein
MEDNMQRRTRTTTKPLDLMPYVWSYGMGAESTAGIHPMLTDPTARPDAIAADFSNLVVVIARTGGEWSTTGRLVQHYILPLLREHNIRLVEVARKCQKARGAPQDAWRANEFGTRPYIHALGFNDEPKRAQRDATYNTALRTGEYPLRTWTWDRARLRRHPIRR